MPTYEAARTLLASREDVWAFLAEPRHLADWWPGVVDVRPDRRGLAPGARWELVGTGKPSLIRRPDAEGKLLVLVAERPRRFAFQLVAERIDVELRLDDAGADRTAAVLTVEGPWLIGLSRRLPRTALDRL